MGLTGINLLDLRQRQPHFVAVKHRLRLLQGVTFEIHRLQFFLVLELLFNLVEVAQLAIARPELLQVFEVFQAF